jgi:hypothetical protein
MDPLVNLQIFDQLRAEVVAVIIRHQVWQLTINLVDNLVDEGLLGNAQMVLQELAPHLLGRQFDDMPVQYLEFLLGVPIRFLNIVLDLLDKFVITLIAVAGESRFVGDP